MPNKENDVVPIAPTTPVTAVPTVAKQATAAAPAAPKQAASEATPKSAATAATPFPTLHVSSNRETTPPPCIKASEDGPLKYTNSVSFTEPSAIERSHRGSISARPSTTNVSGDAPVSALAALSANPRAALSTNPRVAPSRTPSVPSRQASITSRQSSITGDFLQFAAPSSRYANYDIAPTFPLPQSPSSVASPVSDEERLLPELARAPLIVRRKAVKQVILVPTGPPIPFTQYLQRHDDEKIHILLGVSGSVATIKVPLIIDKLYEIYGPDKMSVQVVATNAASHFLNGLKIQAEVKVWRDKDEWCTPESRSRSVGDPILHVELRKWADILLVAPLSANTLAKMANGLSDNLLTSIIRGWNPMTPIIVAPAMNTFMYTHPMTKRHVTQLVADCPWIEVLKPVEKVLVCGDIGMGGMREWSECVEIVRKRLISIRNAKLGIEGDEDEEDEEDEDEDEEDDEEDEEDDDEEVHDPDAQA
ncbi:hypothetical protein BABINDRAFT_163767 [Babjeviella inositovora NRRL Y-12698]|uniref:Flavoprotein domain-containing protein n=1 Tax=Babjeviella inositovora NRRL Y-12698 TaxID=984486 RepID=A0A1E3QH60_9ASCO|nr:uncharacterized protein BABINDRAFT_163767 [Babjeviella inositovora NRRL Y-12698]ODQ77036.1 hypothetical protein BABINDRAFT_163767 [Babjeviella inositovora NRRL Y-12698]